MPSKRWETTSQLALESTAKRLGEVEDRNAMRQKLRERKAANGTSVVFGFDEMSYETDAMSRQKDILKAGKKEFVDGKAMKKTLTATHFVLGNDEPDYLIQVMAQEKRVQQECKESKPGAAVPTPTSMKSSCYFGSDKVSYRTTATDSMALSASALKEMGDTSDMRSLAKKLKGELSGHNFSLGNDALTYKTTANDAFKYEHASASTARGQLLADHKKDLRREHFNFGGDAVLYETDMMRSMKCGEVDDRRIAQMKEDAEAAENLKQKLLRTSVTMGDDPDYM